MPDSEVVRLMRSFKSDLARGERAQMQEMAERWLGVERRLSAQIDALAMQMTETARDGGTVSQGVLFRNERYQELMAQLTDELEGYTEYANRTITDRQRQLLRLGISHAERAITTQGIQAGFNRLPVEAVQNIVGLAGDGSPLSTLLTATWPDAAARLTQELVNGVALGYNPRKTARLMAQGMASTQRRMEVIARTETMRTYNESSRQAYIASGVVTSYVRISARDRRTCFQCLALDGTTYQLNEVMPTHPMCRCTLIPIVSGVPTPKWVQGEEWLSQQSAATQREILGKARYDALQNGTVELSDLVSIVPNAVWGDTLRAKSLAELAVPTGS